MYFAIKPGQIRKIATVKRSHCSMTGPKTRSKDFDTATFILR